MFLELLPEWTHLPLAWIQAFAIVGAGAAVVVWYIKRVRNYYAKDKRITDK